MFPFRTPTCLFGAEMIKFIKPQFLGHTVNCSQLGLGAKRKLNLTKKL